MFDSLQSLRPLRSEDVAGLTESFTTLSGPPRFWRSPTWLLANKANLIGKINSCTLLLRCKVIHANPAIYLTTPPIGPIEKASVLIHDLARIGIRTKLTEEESFLYGVLVDKKPDTVEYIYDGGDIQPGAAGKDSRYGLNLLWRHKRDGSLVLLSSSNILGVTEKCVACAKKWQSQRAGIIGRVDKIVETFSSLSGRLHQHAHMLIDKDESIVAMSLTEQIGVGHAAIVVRVMDYSSAVARNMMAALHALDCAYWAGYQLNIGHAEGVKGLARHKTSIGEATMIPIYNSVRERQFSLDDYRKLKKTVKIMELPL